MEIINQPHILAVITNNLDTINKLQLRLVSKFWLALFPIKDLWRDYLIAKTILRDDKHNAQNIRNLLANFTKCMHKHNFNKVEINYLNKDNILQNIIIHKITSVKIEIYYNFGTTVIRNYSDIDKFINKPEYGIKHILFPIHIPYGHNDQEYVKLANKQLPGNPYKYHVKHGFNNKLYVNINHIKNAETLFTLIKPEFVYKILSSQHCFVNVLKNYQGEYVSMKLLINKKLINFNLLLTLLYININNGSYTPKEYLPRNYFAEFSSYNPNIK